MNDKEIKKLKEQHFESYKNAVIDNIVNNSNVLFDEDIMSLIKKPPLDSMDLIQNKFLSLAKKNKVILNSEELNRKIKEYRNQVMKISENLKKIRIEELSKKVNNTKLKDNEIIKINKKDLSNVNKEMKKLIKEKVSSSIEKEILANVNSIFTKEVDSNIKEKIIVEITKYLKKNYLNQLIESIDIKILVKDTTLINNSKEQAERYLFTLSNSRLLNELD